MAELDNLALRKTSHVHAPRSPRRAVGVMLRLVYIAEGIVLAVMFLASTMAIGFSGGIGRQVNPRGLAQFVQLTESPGIQVAFAGTMALVVLLLGVALLMLFLVVIPAVVTSKLVPEPSPFFPMSWLGLLVQSAVTLVDLGILSVALYAAYQLGAFPRSSASDLLVASTVATVAKLAVAGVVAILRGVPVGVGSFFGNSVMKTIAEMRSRSRSTPITDRSTDQERQYDQHRQTY